jgi:CheY-like chemotaxis protein
MAETLILVVEDEPTIVEVVVRYLQREGFRTLTAGDGPSGRARLQPRKPFPPSMTNRPSFL